MHKGLKDDLIKSHNLILKFSPVHGYACGYSSTWWMHKDWSEVAEFVDKHLKSSAVIVTCVYYANMNSQVGILC